jgi:hypothetical protein
MVPASQGRGVSLLRSSGTRAKHAVAHVPGSKPRGDVEGGTDTADLRSFLLEARVDASLTAYVMATADEYLGRPEPEYLSCFLATLALDAEWVNEYIPDLIAHGDDPDW